MSYISIEEYKEIIKSERKTSFKSPYDLVYEIFVDMGFHECEEAFFLKNASSVIENLRAVTWKTYKPIENEFTSRALHKLVDEEKIRDLSPMEAVAWFVEEYPEHLYNLSLSNTQSRRSRAGNEFESMIELVLMGAGVPFDSQGNIGKKIFSEKGIGKMVDVVIPGVVSYIINKRETVLISAKTTLRERWQEVPEEMQRTGAREMFLVTLDESVSREVLDTLYEANIQLTTTKGVKHRRYRTNRRVLDFETLISICLDKSGYWKSHHFSSDENAQREDLLVKQRKRHKGRTFVTDYYQKRLKEI